MDLPPPQPDVVVIVADDLGQRDLAFYGDLFGVADPGHTPNLDTLAQAGVRFDRMHSNPACTPSRFSLLTGLHPSRGPLGSKVGPNAQTGLPDVPTVATVLGAQGYRTAAFGKWHLDSKGSTQVLADAPREAGFGDGIAVNGFALGPTFSQPNYKSWDRWDNGVEYVEPRYNTRVIGEAFIDWWETTPSPKFAYVAFNAPHKPFHDPPGSQQPPGYVPTENDREQAKAMVYAMDFWIGRMLEDVDLTTTTVFFLADNGTSGDIPGIGQNPDKLKGSCHREGIVVPFVVAGAHTTPGVARHALAQLTDIPFTIARLAGAPTTAFTDGRNLRRVMKEPSRFGSRDWAFSERFSPNELGVPLEWEVRCLTTHRFKLTRIDGVEAFYSLRLDPREEIDLAPHLQPGDRFWDEYQDLRQQMLDLVGPFQ